MMSALQLIHIEMKSQVAWELQWDNSFTSDTASKAGHNVDQYFQPLRGG